MGTVPASTASTERKEVVVTRKAQGGRQSKMTFKFDEVLSSFSTQEDAFSATLQPLIPQVLQGYEATAFAYGQTGTGKTYTMEGNTTSEETRGLMPRAAAAVLDALSKGKYMDHHVAVSYLEIYNEELTDLLAPVGNQPKLDLLEAGGSRGVCCVGLSEVPVSSLDDISRLVCAAQERRRVAETRINARSSRSHCIFTMKVICRSSCAGGEQETVGKLHLVDLAGSECAKKAAMAAEEPACSPATTQKPAQSQVQAVACTAEQERERKNINQSLLTLRRVIAALREKTGRVPYRDSKLTRLLQSALGGSCRTVVIATISPALAVVEETISTLTYAEQAAGIQNRPVAISSTRSPLGCPGGLSLEGLGDLTPAGGGEWSADFEMRMAYMSQEVEEAQAALSRKHQEVQELTERAEHAEEQLEVTRDELAQAMVELRKSEAVRETMVAETERLAAQLEATASASAASMREKVASKAVQLGQQDAVAARERVGELLSTQKAALQSEVAEVRGALDRARGELAAARAENAELRASQARSREAALEALVAAAKRELAGVGEQLDAAAGTVASSLDRAEAHADNAGDSAVGAERQALAAGADISQAAQDWARDVADGCAAIGRASQEAAAAAESDLRRVAGRLRAAAAEGRGGAAAAADGMEAAAADDGAAAVAAATAAATAADSGGRREEAVEFAKENLTLPASAVAAGAKGGEQGAPAARPPQRSSSPSAAAPARGTAAAPRSLKAPNEKTTLRGPLREVNNN